MDDPLVAAVAEIVESLTPPGATILVAVSGGPDSIALLELLHRGRARHGRTLVVAHVDHGIATASAEVATTVEALATRRGLRWHGVTLALGQGASETRARRARRAALEQIARDVGAEAIATAHHADDQAETILLRVLRGSGPVGLAGMAPRAGRWLRPVLHVRREVLHAWLREAGLVGWSDPANRDPRHLRSWLRHQVLPLVAERLPDVVARLTGVGQQAAASRTAWDELPALLPALDLQGSSEALSVAAPPLRGYRSEVRLGLLAALGRRMGVLLGQRRLGVLEGLLRQGGSGTTVRVDRRLEVELSGERLYLRRPGREAPTPVVLPLGGEVSFGTRRFSARPETAGEPTRTGPVAWLPTMPLEVRAWQSGDRIRPLGGTGSRRVAALLREAGVPRGDRAQWPVVIGRLNGEAIILWVPGICRADAALPGAGTEAVRVECHLA
jgi:tRNA(Ile)-lysidine synthase